MLLIVSEFCSGEVKLPGFKIVQAEDPAVDFEFLVDIFSLSVGLWMVSSAHSQFDPKEFSKFLVEVQSKSRVSVRNDLVRKSESSVNVVEVEVCCP